MSKNLCKYAFSSFRGSRKKASSNTKFFLAFIRLLFTNSEYLTSKPETFMEGMSSFLFRNFYEPVLLTWFVLSEILMMKFDFVR